MEVPVDKLNLKDSPEVLSPPFLARLYACAKAVNVTGYVPGATIDIDGAIVINGFPGHFPEPSGATIPVPNPLVAGQQLRVRQHHSGATSAWSPFATVVNFKDDFPAGLPRPELFPTPLYQCGVRTGVRNLLVGCDVSITTDGGTDGEVKGANNPQGVNLNKAYKTGQRVRAWATLCNDPSPPSLEQIVQSPPPVPLPPPGFDPIFDGGMQLVVNTIADGARFTLSRNGGLLGTFPCWGGKFTVNLNSPYHAGETFSATQQLCPGDKSSDPGTVTVQPCSALPAPQIGPVQDGDTQIIITQSVAGSEIKVFVNSQKKGDGSAPVVGLTVPIPHGATVDVWQFLGTCKGSTVQEVTSHCVAPATIGDPSNLDLFPVGTHEYDDGTVTFDGFTYHVRGSIYYPAEDDGPDKPFNKRLAALGPVPLVVCVHGAHNPDGLSDPPPSYQGYDYFQQELAQMGFVAVSVDERETNAPSDWSGGTQNVVRRAELAIASIAFMQQLNASDPILKGTIDFTRTGLMGHSRGAECVIAVTERINLGGVTIPAVLSLAPINSGATSGKPKGYAFMTFLPAADGDVSDNPGARFYDQAVPSPFKVQLYIDHANHNYFNRQWLNDDTAGGLPIMLRPDHERILSTYGCAFFRHVLHGDDTLGYLDGTVLPAGVQTQNVHLAYDFTGAHTVDNYESHPITIDNDGKATAQLGGLTAHDFAFAQTAGAFNQSFFGDTTGNVSISKEAIGDFREPLAKPTDLTHAEVRVRAAEVYQAPTIPPNPTGFRVGVEDTKGTLAWIDVDDVGGLSRPFDRSSFDPLTKTMLSTFRFRTSCFAATDKQLNVSEIIAIHLGLNRGDGRPIAFDDIEIVKT